MKNRLGKLINDDIPVLIPGVFDVFSAKLVESVGFLACSITGFGVAAKMGYPDYGITTFTENIEIARNIAMSVNIPIVFDGDTGFGSSVNLRRVVHECELAGLSGIHFEDQVFPKQVGTVLVSKEKMVSRIKAAVDERQNPNFQLIARCDGFAIEGEEKTIDRAQAYIEAGADLIQIHPGKGLNIECMKRINKSLSVATGSMVTETEGLVRKQPMYNANQLADAGYSFVEFPLSLLLVSAKAMKDVLYEIIRFRNTEQALEKCISIKELFDLVEEPRIKGFLEKYDF